ncbi:MAG: hypothetical protein HUU50_04825 [Candidatus Brocadiae bacterium]|nr:hypothetical protein [Candidatus Brocadiia bacterium]
MAFKAFIQPFGMPISTNKSIFYSSIENQIELLKAIKMQMKNNTGNEYIGSEKGKRAFSVDIARSNFLTPLQEYAASIDQDNLEEIYKGSQQTRFNHLIEIHNNLGVYLPVFNFFPLHIAIKNTVLPIFVGSSQKLYSEIQEIKQMLKPQEQVKLEIAGESFQAGDEDLEDFEANYEGVRHFWPIYTCLIMENLIKKSLEQKLPIFILS